MNLNMSSPKCSTMLALNDVRLGEETTETGREFQRETCLTLKTLFFLNIVRL